MKNNKGLLVVIGIIIIIVLIIVIPKISNKDKGDSDNSSSNGPSVSVTQQDLKKSIEKTENGVKVSNVKINSKSGNFITVSLSAKNENKEERNVDISVTYYDANNKKIGENGFAMGTMQPNESKELESTCYVESLDVKDVKIEVKATEIVYTTNQDGTEGETGSTENV